MNPVSSPLPQCGLCLFPSPVVSGLSIVHALYLRSLMKAVHPKHGAHVVSLVAFGFLSWTALSSWVYCSPHVHAYFENLLFLHPLLRIYSMVCAPFCVLQKIRTQKCTRSKIKISRWINDLVSHYAQMLMSQADVTHQTRAWELSHRNHRSLVSNPGSAIYLCDFRVQICKRITVWLLNRLSSKSESACMIWAVAVHLETRFWR